MAVVVYQCDTCKRETYRQQNRRGLDVISRCVITNGCRGTLSLLEVKPSYSIGHATPPVLGLADWTPRKVLFTYEQSFMKKTWEINHGLNNQPSVSAYIYKTLNDPTSLTKVEPEKIEYTSNDTLRVTFNSAVTGIVQCQARSASDGQNITTLIPVDVNATDSTVFSTSKSFRLSSGSESGEITFATRVSTIATSGFSPMLPIEVTAHFLSPSDLSEIAVPVTLTLRDATNTPVDTIASPWAGVTYTSINGKRYLLRSANIHNGGNLSDLGIPQGAPCYFTVKYQGADRTLIKGELLILNAKSPYQSVDRDYSHVTDVTSITKENASAMVSYVDVDLSGNTSLLEEIFPSIILL